MPAERTVSEIMTRLVGTTRPDARLFEAARLMRELHVSGLPVVDPAGAVVGVLSEKDLVRTLDLSAGISSPRGLIDLLLASAPARGPSLLDICRHRLENGFVREAMTSPAITLPPTATIAEAAERMHHDRIHRLPIVEESGKLVGIVSRADLVAALAPERAGRRRGGLHPRSKRATPARAGYDLYADA